MSLNNINKKIGDYLWVVTAVTFALILLFTNVNVYFFLPPQGIHLSRQMDAYSFASYYYLTSEINFFLPGNLNLESIQGRCASEFPVFYFLGSIFYQFFGPKYIVLKTISVLLFYLSFHYTVKVVFWMVGRWFLSLFLSVMFYSSTVLLYYGTLCLPDTHALCFAILALYQFTRFVLDKRVKQLAFAHVFVVFAGLLKASFLMYAPLLLVSSLFVERNNRKRITVFTFFLVTMVLVSIWYYYVKGYNLKYDSWYYTTIPRPFWNYPASKVLQALHFITNYWYNKYYLPTVFHFYYTVIAVYLILVWPKKRQDLFLIGIISCLNLCYLAMFLTQFIHHDYYIIVIIPSIIIVVSIVISRLLERFDFKWLNISLLSVIILFAILGVNYAKLNLYRRYVEGPDVMGKTKYQLLGCERMIDSLKVPQNARILVVGDFTQNASLVYLGRFGWIVPNFDHKSISKYYSSADYMLILEPSKNKVPPTLQVVRPMLFNLNENHFYKISN